MLRLPTEEEKKLRDIFKPYINGYNEKQPLTSDAPPEAVEAFEKWKELSLRLDKEVIDWMLETEVYKDKSWTNGKNIPTGNVTYEKMHLKK